MTIHYPGRRVNSALRDSWQLADGRRQRAAGGEQRAAIAHR
jgi:hypothetical protein